MQKTLILFDVDGTIVESSQKINKPMETILNKLKDNGFELGIVGGGKLDKILDQLGPDIIFTHYFTECGCIYHKNNSNTKLDLEYKYSKNIRDHNTYQEINKLVKHALKYLSRVEYTLTGNFIDLRTGIIYISLIGMAATIKERFDFIELDKTKKYREKLLKQLLDKADELKLTEKITIVEGGSVGIAIYPIECDKTQVLYQFPRIQYENIYYFGDKYEINGNDHNILNHPDVIGIEIDNPDQTLKHISRLFNI